MKNIPVYSGQNVFYTTIKRSDNTDVSFGPAIAEGTPYIGFTDVGGTFTHSGETKRGYYALLDVFKDDGTITNITEGDDNSLSYTVTEHDIAIVLEDGET